MGVQAAVLHEYDKPLDIEEIELAPTGPGQVRVRIAATGVCHSDLSVIQGKFPHPVPVVLGHEGAGVVTEVGDGVTHLSPGDHVILNWLPACGTCAHCVRDEVYLCEQAVSSTFDTPYATLRGVDLWRGLGTATFATETLTLANAAIPIDKSVPLEVAALIGCAVTTGVGAVLNTAAVEPGSTVAVIGLGGVGLAAVMGAKYAGAERVIAVDFSAERRELALSMGATDVVDAKDDVFSAVRDLTGGMGADYSFEVVGVPAAVESAWNCTRRGGTLVAVGAGSMDDRASFSMFDFFYQSRTIKGCVYGSADPKRDFPRFLEMYGSGQLPIDKLVTNRIRLDQVNDAFATMQAAEGARTVIVND